MSKTPQIPQLRDTDGGSIESWMDGLLAAMREAAEHRVPRIHEVQEWARGSEYTFDLFISMDERNGPLQRVARETLRDVRFLRFAGAPICIDSIVSHMRARKEYAEQHGKIYVPVFMTNDACDASGGNGRGLVNYLFELRGRLHAQLPDTQVVLATYLFQSKGSVIVFKPRAGYKDMRLDTRKLRHSFLGSSTDFGVQAVENAVDDMLAELYEGSGAPIPPIADLLSGSVTIPYPAIGIDRYSHWVGVGDDSLELLTLDDSGLIITAPQPDLFRDDTALSFAMALDSLDSRLTHGCPIPVILSRSYGGDSDLNDQDEAMAKLQETQDWLLEESAGAVPPERTLLWFAATYDMISGEVNVTQLEVAVKPPDESEEAEED